MEAEWYAFKLGYYHLVRVANLPRANFRLGTLNSEHRVQQTRVNTTDFSLFFFSNRIFQRKLHKRVGCDSETPNIEDITYKVGA